jgi:hypothetical protein
VRVGRLGVFLIAVLALSACTGDDDRPVLSSSEFAQRASALCRQFTRSIADAEDPRTVQLAPNADYLDEIIPPLETFVRRLKALRPNESIAQETGALISRHEDLLDAEVEMRDAARRGDVAGFAEAMKKAIPLTYETYNGAFKLGWKGCVDASRAPS